MIDPALRYPLHIPLVASVLLTRDMGLTLSSPWEHFQLEILEAVFAKALLAYTGNLSSQGFTKED